MILKSTRPGILMVPDAGLKLRLHETVHLDKTTPQLDAAIKRGHLVMVEAPIKEESAPAATSAPLGSSTTEPLTLLNATDAIARVGQVSDPAALKELLGSEKRKSVLDALKIRLQEVKGDDPD